MKKPSIMQRVDYILDASKGKGVLHLGCADAAVNQIPRQEMSP
jgi:hypothetical protein